MSNTTFPTNNGTITLMIDIEGHEFEDYAFSIPNISPNNTTVMNFGCEGGIYINPFELVIPDPSTEKMADESEEIFYTKQQYLLVLFRLLCEKYENEKGKTREYDEDCFTRTVKTMITRLYQSKHIPLGKGRWNFGKITPENMPTMSEFFILISEYAHLAEYYDSKDKLKQWATEHLKPQGTLKNPDDSREQITLSYYRSIMVNGGAFWGQDELSVLLLLKNTLEEYVLIGSGRDDDSKKYLFTGNESVELPAHNNMLIRCQCKDEELRVVAAFICFEYFASRICAGYSSRISEQEVQIAVVGETWQDLIQYHEIDFLMSQDDDKDDEYEPKTDDETFFNALVRSFLINDKPLSIVFGIVLSDSDGDITCDKNVRYISIKPAAIPGSVTETIQNINTFTKELFESSNCLLLVYFRTKNDKCFDVFSVIEGKIRRASEKQAKFALKTLKKSPPDYDSYKREYDNPFTVLYHLPDKIPEDGKEMEIEGIQLMTRRYGQPLKLTYDFLSQEPSEATKEEIDIAAEKILTGLLETADTVNCMAYVIVPNEPNVNVPNDSQVPLKQCYIDNAGTKMYAFPFIPDMPMDVRKQYALAFTRLIVSSSKADIFLQWRSLTSDHGKYRYSLFRWGKLGFYRDPYVNAHYAWKDFSESQYSGGIRSRQPGLWKWWHEGWLNPKFIVSFDESVGEQRWYKGNAQQRDELSRMIEDAMTKAYDAGIQVQIRVITDQKNTPRDIDSEQIITSDGAIADLFVTSANKGENKNNYESRLGTYAYAIAFSNYAQVCFSWKNEKKKHVADYFELSDEGFVRVDPQEQLWVVSSSLKSVPFPFIDEMPNKNDD